MMVSVLTMLDISRPVSGGVIAERDEFERAGVAFRVAHAAHATALGEDRDAWADGNLSARLRPKPVDVRRWIDERISGIHCGIVTIATSTSGISQMKRFQRTCWTWPPTSSRPNRGISILKTLKIITRMH